MRIRPPELNEPVGSSAVMSEFRRTLATVSGVDATFLITGEVGTEKQLVARLLHDFGPRRGKPFVRVDCAQNAEVLERKLFGGPAGPGEPAAEGALVGVRGGSVLLEHLTAFPFELRTRLLNALNTRRISGPAGEQSFDAQVLATADDSGMTTPAAHMPTELLVRASVVHLRLPALRERDDDVLELARHFRDQLASGSRPEFSEDVLARLKNYDWPGNVSELEDCVAQALRCVDGDQIEVDHLPDSLQNHRKSASRIAALSLEELERRHIEAVLATTQWNKSEAARKLGIDRTTLYRKLKRIQGD